MPSVWMRLLAISLGGALGANARYWLSLLVNRFAGVDWPWSTFLINTTGSLAIGLLAGSLAHKHPHSTIRLLLIAGFLGSYTTFSTFSLDSLGLWERGETRALAQYLLGSVGAGLLAVWLGVAITDWTMPARPEAIGRTPSGTVQKAEVE